MKITVEAMARRVGCSPSTLHKALKNGLVERESDGSFNFRKTKRGIELQSARRGGQTVGNTGGMSPALLAIKLQLAQEELELTRAKRMRAQQELAKEAGELVLKQEVSRAWAGIVMDFRDAVLSVPEQIAVRCDRKPAREIAAIARELLEGTLRVLAENGGRANATFGTKGKRCGAAGH